MNRWIRMLVAVLLAVSGYVGFVSQASPVSADAEAYPDGRHLSHGVNGGDQTPVWVRVDTSTGAQIYEQYILNSISDYTQSPKLAIYWMGGSICPYTTNCITIAHNGGAPQASGATYYGQMSLHLGHTVMSSNFIAMNLAGANLLQGQYIVCHELGHALGLSHNNSGGSPGPCGSPSSPALHPTANEVNILTFISGHAHNCCYLPNGV